MSAGPEGDHARQCGCNPCQQFSWMVPLLGERGNGPCPLARMEATLASVVVVRARWPIWSLLSTISLSFGQGQGVAEMADPNPSRDKMQGMVGPGRGRDQMQRVSSDSGPEMLEGPLWCQDRSRTGTRCCQSGQYHVQTKSEGHRDGGPGPRPRQDAEEVL